MATLVLMRRRVINSGFAVLLYGILILADGVERLEKHDHGPLTSDHACAACQIAASPVDLPSAVVAVPENRPPAPDSAPLVTMLVAPDAPIPALPEPRGPPLL